ncbi:MAG: dTMP kinase [Chloroflexi bacterium]|nr:dTMP kinase [Chloroflexota bacterium]
MFITLEGPEGSGKSLLGRALAARLEANGRRVLLTREPGGTPLGDVLRDVLLLRRELHFAPLAQALVLAASRTQLVQDVIRPALRSGTVVLCDRYVDSTYAYQGFGHGLALEDLRMVMRVATEGLLPDLTLLLDVTPEMGLARKQRQGATSPSEWNRFEAETLAFHNRVRDGYHALAAEHPERWVRLDATSHPEVVAAEAWHAVQQRLIEDPSPP